MIAVVGREFRTPDALTGGVLVGSGAFFTGGVLVGPGAFFTSDIYV
jgi:hypothetical protein